MQIIKAMDTETKVNLLGEAAQYDICRECGGGSRVKGELGRWIFPAVRPDGKRLLTLKVLQSSVCEKDCSYCAFRAGRDTQRATMSPDELARTFDAMCQRGLVQGLFLSSGIAGGVGRATERILATTEILRRRYHFRGYIHLKILPGADDAAIEASLKLADRVSVNLEAPNSRRIGALSRSKDFMHELLAPLRRAHELRLKLGLPVSMTSQMVVGAAGESDREILTSTEWLYRKLDLARVYYSAFQPIRATPLEDLPATPAWREHRLYQADFLLKQYGYHLDELIFGPQAELPRESDPKQLWAQAHPERFPIELNQAPRDMLLRIPGIGPHSVNEILRRRAQGKLTEMRDTGLPRALQQRAAAYVLLAGRRPPYQPALW
jgi:predicted DNA-binding helix-hairpin-helix protein